MGASRWGDAIYHMFNPPIIFIKNICKLLERETAEFEAKEAEVYFEL